MPFRVVCHDCTLEETFDERYVAASERDVHADETEHFQGQAHDVEYEVVGDGE